MDHDLEIICVESPHGLTIYQVSAQSDVNCRRSYTETKKFKDGRTDRRTDAKGYNIIRLFFKRAYEKGSNSVNTVGRVMVLALCDSAAGPLSMYQVSFNSLVYFQKYAPDKLFMAKMKRESNFVNTVDRVMVLIVQFC